MVPGHQHQRRVAVAVGLAVGGDDELHIAGLAARQPLVDRVELVVDLVAVRGASHEDHDVPVLEAVDPVPLRHLLPVDARSLGARVVGAGRGRVVLEGQRGVGGDVPASLLRDGHANVLNEVLLAQEVAGDGQQQDRADEAEQDLAALASAPDLPHLGDALGAALSGSADPVGAAGAAGRMRAPVALVFGPPARGCRTHVAWLRHWLHRPPTGRTPWERGRRP